MNLNSVAYCPCICPAPHPLWFALEFSQVVRKYWFLKSSILAKPIESKLFSFAQPDWLQCS
jgi:hypothetical protein